MKTRVIYTDIWKDEDFHSLNSDTKIFYLVILLNEDIGQTRIYKCSDRMLEMYSGLTAQQISKCKDDLEVAQLAYFKDGYICIASNLGFIESHYGGKKNDIARAKEFERIPKDVLSYFVAILDTLSIPYQYYIDTTINLNNKSKPNSLDDQKLMSGSGESQEYNNKDNNNITKEPVDNFDSGDRFSNREIVWEFSDDEKNEVSWK